MRLLFPTLFLIILFGSGTISLAQSNEIDYFEVSFKTQQTLTKLQEVINPTNNIELIDLYRNLESSSERLFKILDDVVKIKNIDSDYLITLQSNQVALQGAYNQFENLEFVTKTLFFATSDYENKYKSINFGISPNFVEKVKVVVETKNASGYSVFVKYSYDFDTDVKRYQFNNPTNNAEKPLSPGYYIIWIEKGTYRSKDRLVDIINSDQESKPIYFEIE